MMTEFELINKIKELKQIKPGQGWVVLTKNSILNQGIRRAVPTMSGIGQILGEEIYRGRVSASFYRGRVSASFLDFFRKPAFVLATAVTAAMLLFVGIAGFFYLTERPGEMVEVPITETEQPKAIVLALEELQTEINQATESLKRIKEPQKVLEARNVVVPAIEAVRAVINETEELKAEELKQDIEGRENQILAVLAVNAEIDEFEKTLQEVTAVQAKNLIQDLETRTLTEIQQQILEKARQAYKQGNYIEALINGLFVKQLIQ